jgi:hypothetical protein
VDLVADSKARGQGEPLLFQASDGRSLKDRWRPLVSRRDRG